MFVTANHGKVATSIRIRPFRLMVNSLFMILIGFGMCGYSYNAYHAQNLWYYGGIATIALAPVLFCVAIRHMYRGARTFLS